MKIEFRSAFTKAAKKLPANIQNEIGDIIKQIENAKNIREIISNLVKKLLCLIIKKKYRLS